MVLDIGWPSAVTRRASWRCDKPRSVRMISMARAVRIPAGPISNERAGMAPVVASIRRFGEPAIVVYVPPALSACRAVPRADMTREPSRRSPLNDCCDMGCCVVACPSTTRQRVPDVMLLARKPAQLFGQRPIVPYRFATAPYRLLLRLPFCRKRLRGMGLDLCDLGVAMLTTPPESASGHQRAQCRRQANSPTPYARTAYRR